MTTCVLCDEQIKQPLCPGCIQQGIIQWLHETNNDVLTDELHELTRGIFANYGEMFCIKCESLMSTCSFCYMKAIAEWLIEYPELLLQYVQCFEYENPLLIEGV